MEQHLAAGPWEGQVAEFVEDDEIEPLELPGEGTGATVAAFGFETIDEIDGIEEARSGAVADDVGGDGDGQVRLAGSGSADKDGIAPLCQESSLMQTTNQRLVYRRDGEFEAVEVLHLRQPGNAKAVPGGAALTFRGFCIEEHGQDLLDGTPLADTCDNGLIEGRSHPKQTQRLHQGNQVMPLHRRPP